MHSSEIEHLHVYVQEILLNEQVCSYMCCVVVGVFICCVCIWVYMHHYDRHQSSRGTQGTGASKRGTCPLLLLITLLQLTPLLSHQWC